MSNVYNLSEIKTEKLSIPDNWNKLRDRPMRINHIYYDNQIIHIKLMHAKIKSWFNKPNQLLLYIDHEQLFDQLKPIIKHIKQMMKTSLLVPKKLDFREPDKPRFCHNFGHSRKYLRIKPHLMTKIFMDDVNSHKTVSGKSQCEIYDQTCRLINKNSITEDYLMSQLIIDSECNLVIVPIPWICDNMYGITWKICQLRLYKRDDFNALEKGHCILLDGDEQLKKTVTHESSVTCIDDIVEEDDRWVI